MLHNNAAYGGMGPKHFSFPAGAWNLSEMPIHTPGSPVVPNGHAARAFAAYARDRVIAACSILRRVMETLPNAHWGFDGRGNDFQKAPQENNQLCNYLINKQLRYSLTLLSNARENN